MHRIAAAVAAVVTIHIGNAATTVAERAAGEAHPIVGKWKWTRAFNACTEIYDFRTDGTLSVLSGTKRTDNTFTVTREPYSAGFFELRLKIVKDYGGTDCAGTDNDDTGKDYPSYILFEPGRSMYLSCSEPKLEVCFGPLRRVME